MTTKTNQTYPGMVSNATEFFLVDDQLKSMHAGKIIDFSELPFSTIQILKDAINEDIEVKKTLLDLFPTSEYKRLELFTKCRFGGLDFLGDIEDGVLQNGEYWNCPKRESCPHKGVLCKLPTYNGAQINEQDVKLIQHLSSNLTNECIASEMNMPLGTFHQVKKYLYEKLIVQTKQEVAIIARYLNLI